jgi:hypothetical protein
MILLVTRRGDTHAERVAELLRAGDREVEFVDLAELGIERSLSMDPVSGTGFVETCSGRRVSARDIAAVWYRRPGAAVVDDAVTDPPDRAFAETEWLHSVDGFFSMLGARVVSPPLAQRAAIKPRQLAAARVAGLRTPATLITNDVDEALAFVGRHRAVIHKALSAPQHRFVDTRLWSPQDLEHLGDLPLCPTIFQEYISGPSDLRVTVVGERLFVARIGTRAGRSPVDSRLDLDAPCEPGALPDAVASAVLELMRLMELRFGTVDLRISDSGEHVFFEVNPQGQFLYIEILTGLPIAAAVADYLSSF